VAPTFAKHDTTGEFNDIHFRKFQEGGYQVLWGSVLLGHVHYLGSRFAGWTAYDTEGCYMVEGFASRAKAADYLTWLNGIWREERTPTHSIPKRPVNSNVHQESNPMRTFERCLSTGTHDPHEWSRKDAIRWCPGNPHVSHDERCCRQHGTHSMPHKGCILR